MEPVLSDQAPPAAATSNEDRQAKLEEVEKLIDVLGKKRDTLLARLHEPSRKTVVDTARHTLGHWTRVIANYDRLDGESACDYRRRLKKEGLTDEKYRQSKAT